MTDDQAEAAKRLQPYIGPFGYQFANKYKHKHPDAITYVLDAVWKRCLFGSQNNVPLTIAGAWAYANKVLVVKEPMFNEADAVNRHRVLMKQIADNAKQIFG